MQTFNKTNNAFEVLSSPAKKPSSGPKKENKDDFLNMVLNAAASRAKQGESISEKDVKQIAKSVSMQNENLAKTEQEAIAKVASDIATKLDDTTKNELYENANFMQLLQVLEILNGGEQISKYPNFSDKIANFLSNAQNVAELSEVKSVSELLDLAKKFDLGLEKITISETDAKNLNEMFKNLGKNEFFTPVLPPQPKLMSDFKKDIEQNLSQTDEPKTPKLNDLLKEVVAPTNITKNIEAKPQILAQPTPEVIKEVVKNETEQTMPLDDAKVDDADAMLKETTAQEIKQPKKVTLENLLYPERTKESSEVTQTTNEGVSVESDLNSMVRDIAKNAQSQIQNRIVVKETLTNFSQNLAEQVANYKAPFTRVHIALNPLNLGEVEVTMINRGNNLHLNFNSNTNTMNLFLQNQAEFKNSLVNMGFTELEMNFSDQNQKQQEQGKRLYKNLSNSQSDSLDTEISATTLELVIPRYA
ncbi:flagellar hook-length control protein FliK [Campylobacter mucosalis]|uniref:Flagellar hook-length control protein n=1 Tax=Campylobacter mucosalis CCUG 21559 TaxID=1032067 RepID=A0A6G5QFR1_9BACT|nr:flagellar hook-length control protein FliK [Campylobacter mucosalis]QCD44346.1 flagellar hook-length control protein [Campylobacter mucosalis CCUG 21559]